MSDHLNELGIVIGVILAVGGYLVAKKVIKKRQSQSVKNGTGIQAGRDIRIND